MRIGIDSCRDYMIEWNMYTLSITLKSGSSQDQYIIIDTSFKDIRLHFSQSYSKQHRYPAQPLSPAPGISQRNLQQVWIQVSQTKEAYSFSPPPLVQTVV